MIDYVGRSRSTMDDMEQWGQYFGNVENRRQAAWQNNELRSTLDRANRYNRAGAISDRQFQQENAGLFQNTEDTLAGLHPQNVAAAGPTNRVTGMGTTTADPTGTATGKDSKTTAGVAIQPIVGSNAPVYDRAHPTIVRDVSRDLNPEQQAAWQRYREVMFGRYDPADAANPNVRGVPRRAVSPEVEAEETARLRSAGLELWGSRLRRMNYTYSDEALAWPTNTSAQSAPASNTSAPSVDPRADLQAPTAAPAAAPQGGLNPSLAFPGAAAAASELDSYYNGVNDTSRPLQPTREMRMTEVNVRNALRLADLAAQHGDRETAQQQFAMAMEQQATLLGQHHNLLYRAATSGSLDAASVLLAEMTGLPPGTVRMQPTDERRPRFSMQIQDANGEWVTASEVPVARNDMLAGLQNLVDAAGAQARTEAYQELLRTQIEAGADITVAQIRSQTDLAGYLNQREIAQLDARVRMAIEQGDAELIVNNDDGSAYVRYNSVDSTGNFVPTIGRITQERQRVPNARGRGEERDVPVYTAVTGINNVRAQ